MRTKIVAPLPGVAQEIAEVIGREKALAFIGQLPATGGRAWRVVVYIPKTLRVDHPLVEMLGWHDAAKMVRAFSGMILQPSNCRYLEREARWRRVLELKAEGVVEAEIAEQVGLSVDRVRDVIAGRKITWSTRRTRENAA